jgi:catechol 2,3-dioxygenase-like lactoylglutathione lyase family enzyme
MKPRIHVITLAVSDLNHALAFYRDGLGLESAGDIAPSSLATRPPPQGRLRRSPCRWAYSCLIPAHRAGKGRDDPFRTTPSR